MSLRTGGGRRKAGSGAPKAPPARVRISAGKWKGRAIEVPPGARPTSSRAREALFDLIGDRLRGARVLDLYAGSGAVGLEAISRGAAAAVLVEPQTDSLSRTLERLGPEDAVRVVPSGAAAALRQLGSSQETFDLIFCDPPYGEQPGPALGRLLSPVAAAGSIVVFQADAGGPPPRLEGFFAVKRRAYGRNVFHFFVPSPESGL